MKKNKVNLKRKGKRLGVEESAKLGDRIRQMRKKKGLTLKDIGKATGLTLSHISQIETNKVHPSITALSSLAKALDTTIANLFEPYPEKNPVVRIEERRVLKTKNNIDYYLLTPSSKQKLEVLYEILKQGASTGDNLYTHEGEEFGLVIKGKIKVFLGKKEYILKEGDGISFPSTVPHRKENINKGETILLWVDTPPTF